MTKIPIFVCLFSLIILEKLAVRADCGGQFNTPSGRITSPGYPNENYGGWLDCTWEISLPPEFQIRVSFGDIQLADGCNDDYLLIETDGNELDKWCNDEKSHEKIYKYNQLTIKFVTDLWDSKKGFSLQWEAICVKNIRRNSSDPQTISSPSFTSSFRGVTCVWNLTTDSGYYIHFTIQTVVESTNNDSVELYEPVGNKTRLVLKGTRSFSTTGNNLLLYLHFGPDSNGQLSFAANWTTGCSTISGKLRGEIVSPWYPMQAPNSAECEYVIDVGVQMLFIMDFDPNNFGLEGVNGSKSGDTLTIFNSGSVLRTLKGTTPPGTITTKASSIIFWFKSDSFTPSKGYRILYRFEDLKLHEISYKASQLSWYEAKDRCGVTGQLASVDTYFAKQQIIENRNIENEEVMWTNHFLSQWTEIIGCFQIPTTDAIRLEKLPFNSATGCFQKCNYTDMIGLQDSKCLCFTNETSYQLIAQISDTECDLQCIGQWNDRCGGRNAMSVYRKYIEKEIFSHDHMQPIHVQCVWMYTNNKNGTVQIELSSSDCQMKRSYGCTEINGSVDVYDDRYRKSWFHANKECSSRGQRLALPRDLETNDKNVTNSWVGIFRSEAQVKTELPSHPSMCKTVTKTKDTLQFNFRECTTNLSFICRQYKDVLPESTTSSTAFTSDKTGWTVYTTTTEQHYDTVTEIKTTSVMSTADFMNTTQDKTTNKSSQSKGTSKVVIIAVAAGFLVVLLVIVMLIVYDRCIRKRRKTGGKPIPAGSEENVYELDDADCQVPPDNRHEGEMYSYSHAMGGGSKANRQSFNEEQTYDHVQRGQQPTINFNSDHNIYDHTGMREDYYDHASVTAQKTNPASRTNSLDRMLADDGDTYDNLATQANGATNQTTTNTDTDVYDSTYKSASGKVNHQQTDSHGENNKETEAENVYAHVNKTVNQEAGEAESEIYENA